MTNFTTRLNCTKTTRRNILIGGVASIGAAGTFTTLLAQEPSELERQALEAAKWGLPLVQTARYLKIAKTAGFELNQFYLNQELATPATKVGGPNIDTIYGFAWLEVKNEPIIIDVPKSNDRYYSIQLLDAYENTFKYIGTREEGNEKGSFAIVDSGYKGQLPSGIKKIISPTNIVFVLTRTLVKGNKDLKDAQDFQAQFTTATLSNYPNSRKSANIGNNVINILPVIDYSSTGYEFFDELNELVKKYPPIGQERVNFEKLSQLGLGTNANYKTLGNNKLSQIFKTALKEINSVGFLNSELQNGWRVNYNITKFISNNTARAATNIYGPGAHIAEEALYFAALKDIDEKELNGRNTYVINFEKGKLPPVKAFWSLILYDNNFWLVDNPISRYSINDRTDGLVYEEDGSLKIIISNTKPQNISGNWLPAPKDNFRLIFRTYLPEKPILDKSYKLPPVTLAK